MPFLGSQPADQYQSLAKQTITGDGSTAYTLSRSVTNAYDMEVFINNVRQEPDTSYSASGNTITFTAALTASDSCYLIYQGQSVGSINPPANSVGGNEIQNTSVTTAHLHTSLDLSSKTLTMPAGHVIQVAHHKWSTAATTTSTSLSDVAGSSFTFTAKQASSKLYILTDVSITQTRTATGAFGHYELNIDGSVIQQSGDTFEIGVSVGGSSSVNIYQRAPKSYFINASNTSAKTIKLQFATDNNANSGQTRINVNSQFYSAITVMEIAQ